MLDVDDMLAAGVVVRACTMDQPETMDWGLDRLAGRLSELSSRGCGATTMAAGLIWEAQSRGEPCAWVMRPDWSLNAPDMAAIGVDLDALAVLRVEKTLMTVEYLVSSGGFSVVVVDYARRQIPPRALLRLAKPARLHNTAVLFLTCKGPGEESLGSMIGLHAVVSRERQDSGFACHLSLQKDKHQGRSRQQQTEVYHGPPGLC